ncbi:MAG: protein-glutamate O-methyltransferase CheR [Actinobacteria bacterium]|nr:protein-glutamate O-methyltransferase CheR [Actinomycetota bacterium]
MADHLTRHAGFSFSGHRTVGLNVILQRELSASGASDAAGYVALLEREPARWQALIDQLTIGETHFFREAGHLELLHGRILPELRARRPSGHRFKLWSAGCASGEEAYTLALVLHESGLSDRADVLGTDISPAALREAARATYRRWSLRGVEEDRVRAYFRRDGDRFRLDERFAGDVDFRTLNLLRDPYPTPDGGFDVVFCRNVLIYLTPAAVARVVQRLVESLAEGGWLITASSDPHLSGIDSLETVVTAGGVVYRRRRAHGPSDGEAEADTTDRRQLGRHGRPTGGVRRRPAPIRSRPPRAPRPALDDEPDVVLQAGDVPQAEQDDVLALVDAGRHEDALAALSQGDDRSPTDAQRHHLRAVLLVETGRWQEAVKAATAALYLDPSAAVTEIVLGRAQLGRGDRAAAARAFRNARTILSSLPADQPVVDGMPAGRLLAELDALASARTTVAP